MGEGNYLTENQEALMDQSRRAQAKINTGNPDAGRIEFEKMADPSKVQAEYDNTQLNGDSVSTPPETTEPGLLRKFLRLLRGGKPPPSKPATKAA